MFVLITRKTAYLVRSSSTYYDKVDIPQPTKELALNFEIPKVWLILLEQEKADTISITIDFKREEPNLKGVPPQEILT